MNDDTVMVDVAVINLSGLALDFAVGLADGREVRFLPSGYGVFIPDKKGFVQELWRPSSDWSQGGPLRDKYNVSLKQCVDDSCYAYFTNHDATATGATALSAICRVIVFEKLGDIVKVPACLVGIVER